MTDVVMPQMGESIVEGTLTKWLKKPGDHVERDEPLFEISTDKVDTEIPSPSAGTLSEVLVEEGKTVQINTVVARISDGNGAAPARAAGPERKAAPPPQLARAEAEAPLEPAQEVVEPTPAPQQVEEVAAAPAEPAGPISPLVRRLARENNIDLNQVRGTGAGGRITKQDVEAYLAQRQARPQAPVPTPPPPQPPAAQAPPPPAARAPIGPAAPVQAPPPSPLPTPPAGAKTRIEPLSTMRQKIAEHMLLSRRTSAHVTTVHRVDMTKVARMRERHKADVQARYGFSLTYLPFITRAAVVALRQYPLLNASLDTNSIIYHNEINIGIAVALENGLIVPVIRGADEKNVLGLQHSIVDLATRARARQLKPEEVQGGTFSITNFGSFGSVMGTPIINQPQVAILGVGTVDKTPVVIDDAIAIRSVSYLSLSFDHRLIDGALADQFMTRVRQVLEDWSEDVL
ncbi:MAG TPA: 2-oxoglutarate dehydrogenase, E2 component, dihydrolipoamide succinyltransferase [Bryobacteraceae bacterium]|nr:2-oxoglutarate dehydrogenase, E2 component, dihydrolipoamide succinyltransferase [Bryobacteraceae bacterium]